VSLRDAERATRISRRYLEALEAHDFEKLPPAAYARGIVRNYAQYLGLDPQVVLSLYQQAADDHDEALPYEVTPATQPLDVRAPWAPNFALIGFMLVVSAIVFAWFYSAYFQPNESVATVTAAQPTPTSVDGSLLTLVAGQPTPTATVNPSTVGTLATSTPSLTEVRIQTPTAPPATEAPEQDEPTEAQVATEPSEDALIGPDGEPVPEGQYLFELFASEDVWVYASIDGVDVFDGTLGASQWLGFVGLSMTVTSGNAELVQVFIDGEGWGALSTEQWDAVVTYP
jgi:cytoskeletal protein RodZ